VTRYRIDAEPSVDADIEAAFQWMKVKRRGSGSNSLMNCGTLIEES